MQRFPAMTLRSRLLPLHERLVAWVAELYIVVCYIVVLYLQAQKDVCESCLDCIFAQYCELGSGVVCSGLG